MLKYVTLLEDMSIRNEFKSEIESKLLYLSNAIMGYSIKTGEKYIKYIELYCCEPIDAKKILHDFLKKEFSNRAIMREINVWKSNKRFFDEKKRYADLREAGIVFEYGSGLVAIGEPILSLMRYIDRRLMDFALSYDNAKEYVYPTIIQSNAIDKTNYVNSAVNYLFFVNSLHNDMRSYDAFINDYRGELREIRNISGYFEDQVAFCLPPTMCYHVYNQFKNTSVESPFFLTACGKSFRNEQRYACDLERLIDFTIRESVFIGDYKYVESIKNDYIFFLKHLITEFDLMAECVSANDMFFRDDKADYRIRFQKKVGNKLEIRVNTTTEHSIAVGSINYHDNFFVRNFGIRSSVGERTVSGCTGFGLERFAYAFICQHGIDASKWPIKI